MLAVPAAPDEQLYLDLKAAGLPVERVGDCVAPRRAHAAVVEGERRAPASRLARSDDGHWWQQAVVYQVYVRSFADTDGDGIGDLEGLRRRLGHIASLGVDAIWLCPVYPSPQRDHGYDVADYFDVDPDYGDLATFDRLVADAREHGLRVLMDIVPNHCSDQHPWFQAALAAAPGSDERARFWFRDGHATAAAQQLAGGVRRVGAGRPSAATTRSGTSARSRRTSPTSTTAIRPSTRCSPTPCASGSTVASTGSASTPCGRSARTPPCPTPGRSAPGEFNPPPASAPRATRCGGGGDGRSTTTWPSIPTAT